MASGAVIAVAMTLNELCTNTTKFGALSVPEGHVDIAWRLERRHNVCTCHGPRGTARRSKLPNGAVSERA
jgi:two-component sensor histidine kinase